MNLEERFLTLVNEMELAQRGSLWMIHDNVWEQAVQDFVRKRKGHPGLAIGTRNYRSLQDTVPLMIGNRKKHGGFRVEGVGANGLATYFHRIRPKAVQAGGESPVAIQEFDGGNPDITRNKFKPSLDAEELRALNQYLATKGVQC